MLLRYKIVYGVFHGIASFLCAIQAFEDHVKWCQEKSRRLQDSPKKDHEAIAKLNLRITYKPKTPLLARKSTGSSTAGASELDDDRRKESFESTQSNRPSQVKSTRKVSIKMLHTHYKLQNRANILYLFMYVFPIVS